MMWDSLSSKRLVNWNYFIVHFTTMNKGRNKVSCCKKCRNKAGNLNFVLSDTKRTPIGCLLFNLEMFKYLVTSEFQNKRKVIKLWCITNVSFKKKLKLLCRNLFLKWIILFFEEKLFLTKDEDRHESPGWDGHCRGNSRHPELDRKKEKKKSSF